MDIRTSLLSLAAALVAAVGAVAAEPASIDRFVGRFYGAGIVDEGGGALRPSGIREASVVVGKLPDGGFLLTWSAITRVEALHEPKSKTTTLRFVPTAKPGVFVAAGEAGAPGRRTWAEIHGATLTVYVMDEGASGGPELQQWDRKVDGNRMELTYRRVSAGEPVRVVRSTLAREVD
ncbi:MAG: hypothetical protein L6R19_01685 [Alphaproteobacteria bacterium]|nr:hypothetical protein [Alphaproteobacteria bacterium]